MGRPVYCFGTLRIDLAARELRRDGEPLTISPKVFDCIAYLIEHCDRAVGRDELIAAVWGRADVADIQLGQLMRKVRRTVDDDGDHQTVIRTVPRFGFRWIAEILEDAPSTSDAQQPIASSVAGESLRTSAFATRTLRASAAAGLLLGICVLAVATGYWRLRQPVTSTDTLPSMPSPTLPTQRQQTQVIAVLPVEVAMPAATETAWMRLGMMDLIASRLRGADLAVVPSSNVVGIGRDGVEADVLERRTREATGARYVAVPSVRLTKAGDWEVRIELRDSDLKPRDVQAVSIEAITAARDAADRLLSLLGRPPPQGSENGEASEVELMQRIDAAYLVDDFEGARKLIDGGPPRLRESPEAKLYLAKIDIETKHLDAADRTLTELLAALSPEAAPVLRARVLVARGVAAFREAQQAASEKYFSDAIALLQERNEPDFLGAAYTGRGSARDALGRYDEAASDYSRGRIAFELAADPLGLARIEHNEAMLDVRRRHYAEALPVLERSAERFERVGASEQLAMALLNMMSVRLLLLQTKDALAIGERADAAFHGSANSDLKFTLKLQQAYALQADGQLSKARAMADEMLRIAQGTGDATLSAMIWGLEGEIAFESGEDDTAAALTLRSVDGLATQTFRLATDGERSEVWLIAIRVLRRLHREPEADAELAKFSTWAQDSKNPFATLRLRLADAEHVRAGGNRDAAYRLYDDAMRAANELNVPDALADVVYSYGNVLLDDGESEKASAVIGEVGRWSDQDFRCAVLQVELYQTLGRTEAWRAALDRARGVAGERPLPSRILIPPRDMPLAMHK